MTAEDDSKRGDSMSDEPLYDTPTLARRLGIPERTLSQYAYLGKGPAFIKIGRHRRYRHSDVEKWLDSLTVERRPL